MLSYSMKFSGFVELILILIESYLTTLRTTLLACWDILPPIRYSAFRETLNLRGSAEAASRHTDGEDTSMTDENRTEPSSVITTTILLPLRILSKLGFFISLTSLVTILALTLLYAAPTLMTRMSYGERFKRHRKWPTQYLLSYHRARSRRCSLLWSTFLGFQF